MFESGEFEATAGTGGYVVNHGLIAASVGGSVSLLGETVTNTGVIVATLGQVNLASGSRAVVNFGSEQLLGIEITEQVLENNEGLKAAVSNAGTIDADGGAVLLTSSVSKSLFDHAINNEGVIKAKSAEYKNGVIRLFGSGSSVLNTGTLDASSSNVPGGHVEIVSDNDVVFAGNSQVLATSQGDIGGSVTVHGDSVLVGDQSRIAVSGTDGGGEITINANATAEITADASLVADAIVEGDGGLIDISAESIQFAGSASARGGKLSGDGGEVALTATESLAFSGSVDTSAPNGALGTLTLTAPQIDIADDAGVTAGALESSTANIDLNASASVTLHDLSENELDLGDGSLSINVEGVALSAEETDAVGFFMVGADDVLATDGTVTVQVTDAGTNANSLIDIAGRIEATPQPAPLPNEPRNPGNDIALTANQGRVRIRSSAELNASGAEGSEAGRMFILATGFDGENESGTVHFSGAADVSSSDNVGGQVRLLGDRVGLFGDASIDASGALGGGTVLVGGNFQGNGPEQNSLRTYVSAGSTISADAVDRGKGGTVIVWANEYTRVFGEIYARGGSRAGDGGFVEILGKEQLQYAGSVDTTAANGSMGELLLDPLSIDINAVGENVGGDLDGAVNDDATSTRYAFTEGESGTGSDFVAIIAPSTINGLSSVTPQAEEDITVTSAVSLSTASASITLEAGRDIAINASITTMDGTVTISADDGGAVAGNDNVGTVTIGAAIDAGDALIDIDGAVVTFSGTGSADAGTNTINVNADFGAVTLMSGSSLTADSIVLVVETDLTASGTLAETTSSSGSLDVDFGQGNGGNTADISSATLIFAGSSYGTIDGGTGSDTLIGRDTGETFATTAADEGTIDSGDVTYGTVGAIESITGGSGADTFNLGHDVTGSVAGGADDDTFNVDASISASLSGDGGDDSFSIDDTVVLTGTIDGGAEAGVTGDTLDLSQSSAVTDVTITGNGATDGLDGTNASVSGGFDNINIITGSGVATSTLTGSALVDTFTTSAADAGTITLTGNADYSGFDEIAGAGDDDVFNLGHDVTGSVAGGADDDTFNVDASISASLSGDAGDDSFSIDDGVVLTGTIDGGAEAGVTGDTLDLSQSTAATDVTITGNGATDGLDGTNASVSGGFDNINIITGSGVATSTLTGPALVANWTLTGVNAGTLTLTGNADFSGFDELAGGGTDTLVGTAGGDVFTSTAANAVDVTGSVSTTGMENIDGGGGTDTLNLGHDFTTVAGGADDDTFNVDASISASLSGDAGDDSFSIDDGVVLTGTIDGGAEAGVTGDTLDLSQSTATTDVTITGNGATDGLDGTNASVSGGFDNINIITGSGVATSTLTGPALVANWTLTGVNVGTLTLTGNADFSGFDELAGGGTDTLVGTAGGDVFTSTAANAVDVTGSVSTTGMENIDGGGGVAQTRLI